MRGIYHHPIPLDSNLSPGAHCQRNTRRLVAARTSRLKSS